MLDIRDKLLAADQWIREKIFEDFRHLLNAPSIALERNCPCFPTKGGSIREKDLGSINFLVSMSVMVCLETLARLITGERTHRDGGTDPNVVSDFDLVHQFLTMDGLFPQKYHGAIVLDTAWELLRHGHAFHFLPNSVKVTATPLGDFRISAQVLWVEVHLKTGGTLARGTPQIEFVQRAMREKADWVTPFVDDHLRCVKWKRDAVDDGNAYDVLLRFYPQIAYAHLTDAYSRWFERVAGDAELQACFERGYENVFSRSRRFRTRYIDEFVALCETDRPATDASGLLTMTRLSL